MSSLKAAIAGCVLTLAVVALCGISYYAGRADGIRSVVSECSFYRKYGVDGTQYMLCSGILNPEEMMPPSVAETNAKFYSKENKDKHKKDRK